MVPILLSGFIRVMWGRSVLNNNPIEAERRPLVLRLVKALCAPYIMDTSRAPFGRAPPFIRCKREIIELSDYNENIIILCMCCGNPGINILSKPD